MASKTWRANWREAEFVGVTCDGMFEFKLGTRFTKVYVSFAPVRFADWNADGWQLAGYGTGSETYIPSKWRLGLLTLAPKDAWLTLAAKHKNYSVGINKQLAQLMADNCDNPTFVGLVENGMAIKAAALAAGFLREDSMEAVL